MWSASLNNLIARDFLWGEEKIQDYYAQLTPYNMQGGIIRVANTVRLGYPIVFARRRRIDPSGLL